MGRYHEKVEVVRATIGTFMRRPIRYLRAIQTARKALPVISRVLEMMENGTIPRIPEDKLDPNGRIRGLKNCDRTVSVAEPEMLEATRLVQEFLEVLMFAAALRPKDRLPKPDD